MNGYAKHAEDRMNNLANKKETGVDKMKLDHTIFHTVRKSKSHNSYVGITIRTSVRPLSTIHIIHDKPSTKHIRNTTQIRSIVYVDLGSLLAFHIIFHVFLLQCTSCLAAFYSRIQNLALLRDADASKTF